MNGRMRMTRSIKRTAQALALGLILTAPAAAHPHITIEARATVSYDGGVKLAAIRHVWAFDPVYSAFLAMGIPKDADGTIPESRMQALAASTVASLAASEYFTRLKANGLRQTPAKAEAPTMSFSGERVILSFTLPLDEPAEADRSLLAEVMDPTYFVAFSFAPGDDAVRLEGAPSGCAATVTRPKGFDPATAALLAAGDLAALASADLGTGIVNKATVACP
jgi:ABC-type uncharacterized transport system substrate-binding protein